METLLNLAGKVLTPTAEGTPPPLVSYGDFVTALRKYGPWQRHLLDRELARKYGHVFRFVPPPGSKLKWMLTVSDPEVVKQVLSDRETFPTRGQTGLSNTVSQGLVELPTGPRHSFHRRIIGQLLTHKHLVTYSVTVQEETEVLLKKWFEAAASNKTVNAHYDLTVLTEEIIGIIGLGQRFGVQRLTEEENVQNEERAFMLKSSMLATALGPWAMYLRSPSNFYREQNIRSIGKASTEQHVQRALAAAESATGGANMISAMKHAKDEEMGQFTPAEIIDEFITIRGAGHETTSNTLSWAVLLLAQNPAQQERLFQEIDKSVKGFTCTIDEADQMKFLQMCMFETLRIFPTVPSVPRLSAKATKLGGYDIPEGTMVFVSCSVMHRRTDLWGKDAEVFRPDRFDHPKYSLELEQAMPKGCPYKPNKPDEIGHEFGFVPFGAGNRTCPGQRLALMEGCIILASIVKHFRIVLAQPDTKVAERTDITLGPKKGLPIKLIARHPRLEASKL